jgi:hypothetical protein
LGVDVSTDDPVIVEAADAAVGAVAVMVEVLGAEVGNAIEFSCQLIHDIRRLLMFLPVLAPAAALSHGLGGDTDAMRVRCRLSYNSTRIGVLRDISI